MKVGTNWVGFTVGHRIAGHPKCGRIHGHNLRVRVIVDGEVDAKTGMVVDFGVLKKALSDIVDPLDHHFLAARGVGYMNSGYDGVNSVGLKNDIEYVVIDCRYILPKEDVIVLPLDIVSSENLAGWILGKLYGESWAQGKILTVQVSETGDNIAEASQFVGGINTQLLTVTGWTSTSAMNPIYYWQNGAKWTPV